MFRRSLPVSPKIVGAAALAVFALAAFIGYTAISGPPGYPYAYVKVHYATASNLVVHNDVRIDSKRVGQISQIAYKDGQAVLTLQLNPGTKVYRNASAGIGDVSSLGSEFVALDPGTPGSGPIGTEGIPTSRTTEPVEIDTVLGILQPKVRDALSSAVQTLGTGVANEGGNLHDLIAASPSLLPNVATTNATLAAPDTDLSGLVSATNLLASRFDGRTQQLASLLAQMDTTLQAVNVSNTSALQDTLTSTAPALSAAVPSLHALSDASGATAQAMTVLRPGFAAAGAGTPDLRAFLRDGAPVMGQVPPVAQVATPALSDLAGTAQQIEHPTVPFLAELINQSDPLLTYLAPYSQDIYSLNANLSSALSDGNGDGTWLRIASFNGSHAQSAALGSPPAVSAQTECRDPYPAPGQAYQDRKGATCP